MIGLILFHLIKMLWEIIKFFFTAPIWLVLLIFFIFIFLYWVADLFGLFDDNGVSGSTEHGSGSDGTFNDKIKQNSTYKSAHLFIFYDAKGYRRSRGDCFFDSQGYLRNWGDGFYDGKGYYKSWGDSYYDARGYFRSWGDPFYDAQGNIVYPD